MPLQARPLLNRFFILSTIVATISLSAAFAQSGEKHPWSNSALSPDERASMVLKEMTIDEKVTMLHGTGMQGSRPGQSAGGKFERRCGICRGHSTLGYSRDSDVRCRLRGGQSGENGRYSTALPGGLAAAASWDLDAAYEYGA